MYGLFLFEFLRPVLDLRADRYMSKGGLIREHAITIGAFY